MSQDTRETTVWDSPLFFYKMAPADRPWKEWVKATMASVAAGSIPFVSRETRALAEGVVHYATQEDNTCSNIEESTSPGEAMTQCNLKGLLKLWPSKTTGTQKTSRPGQRIQKAGRKRARGTLTLDNISPFLDLRGLSDEIAQKMTVPIRYNKYVYEYSSSEEPGFKVIDGQHHIFYINLIAFCLAFQSDPEKPPDPLCI